MSDVLQIKVAARRKEPIPFALEGSDHVYSFKPPKQAGVFMPLLLGDAHDGDDDLDSTRATFKWLDKGLSKDDMGRIEARLRDPEDDLDFDSLAEVVKALMERASARPTS
jgi:hypothetical protein